MTTYFKVVTAQEMARIEKGGDSEAFMAEAGRKVAERAIDLIQRKSLPKQVTLLVGKGNNGGDAYAAGLVLLEAGYSVNAFQVFPECSPLNQKFGNRFRKKQGKMLSDLSLSSGLILDGLLGTGFNGKVQERIAAVIRIANESRCPILAIDIPSGLDGTTGIASGAVIHACETVALGLPKIGCFVRDGWNFVGKLHVADFGLSKSAIERAEPLAFIPKKVHLPKILRNRHKYQAGYVIGYGGSEELPGAAKMAGFAALKSGAGIVRLYHPGEIGPVPDELICTKWNAACWKSMLKKAQAVFVGPGLGKGQNWLKTHLKEIKQPSVFDADALLPELAYPKGAILTPHRGEALRLLKLKKAPDEEEFFALIARFCEKKNVFVVLKGAPTFIFAPHSKPFIIPRGDPGMATAGAGDVLTGMIASLLAQGCSILDGALLGVILHAIAGEYAADSLTSYCMTATDIIDFMPNAFRFLLQENDIV